jgi:hypothetical protein
LAILSALCMWWFMTPFLVSIVGGCFCQHFGNTIFSPAPTPDINNDRP